MKLKNNVKKYRKEAYLSRRQLSEICGVSEKTIFDIEHNKERERGYNKANLLSIFNSLRIRVEKLKKYTQLYPVK